VTQAPATRTHPHPPLAGGVLACPHSGIRDVAHVALAMPDAIRLEIGQPDFPTPAHIGEAAKRAIDEGWTFYTHTLGLASLREAIAAKLERVNGYTAHPDNIACTSGGVGAVAATFAAVLEEGDEVLVPDPAWPNYAMLLSWMRARYVPYPCPPELGFQPDVERLASLITPRTKLLVVNSPNNPGGAVYSRKVLEELASLVVRHDLWLLSDECYDQLVFGAEAVSPASFLDDGRVVSVYAFSKTYSMTGWRLGYAVGSRELIDGITKVLESSCTCPSTVSQKAGEAALLGPQDAVSEMADSYRRRRDLVADIVRDAGLLLSVPEGAFYIMADVSPAGMPSAEFAMRLLEQRRVGVAPGTAFGSVAADAVRITLASSEEDLREGVTRLCEFVRSLA
jgi:aspartate/methionine/tyrosine aminotransferase